MTPDAELARALEVDAKDPGLCSTTDDARRKERTKEFREECDDLEAHRA